MAKTAIHKVLFLMSMDSKRSKDSDGSQFWALECLLTGSGWLESIQAIMAPPCSKTYIPDLALDRVKRVCAPFNTPITKFLESKLPKPKKLWLD